LVSPQASQGFRSAELGDHEPGGGEELIKERRHVGALVGGDALVSAVGVVGIAEGTDLLEALARGVDELMITKTIETSVHARTHAVHGVKARTLVMEARCMLGSAAAASADAEARKTCRKTSPAASRISRRVMPVLATIAIGGP
jgi:hypothetical protein